MKKIKTLTVLFDKVLKPNEIPKFRGAVLGKIDQPDLLFHNHFDKEQFVYEYPWRFVLQSEMIFHYKKD